MVTRLQMTEQPPSASTFPLSVDLDRLRPVLHRYCARMVGSSLDGEDIVQEALLRALEAPAPNVPIDNPGGWLFRIAHNLALDFLRRRARHGDAYSEGDMDAIPHPVDEHARRDAAASTLPMFMHLPASQRSVVILFDVLEYSAEEVGLMLETTVPAVKSTLQRGRSRLRALAIEGVPPARLAALSPAQVLLLRKYVELFNARDFDAISEMLAADVRLDLVNRLKLQGPEVGEYYTRYRQAQGWKAMPGIVEGRPAVLMQSLDGADGRPNYFIMLEWEGERISTIRDFLFAKYAMEAAEHSRV